jgi:hypothetical protein
MLLLRAPIAPRLSRKAVAARSDAGSGGASTSTVEAPVVPVPEDKKVKACAIELVAENLVQNRGTQKPCIRLRIL